jgi:hypothetical protein
MQAPNKCSIGGELLHPDWWTNFGFHERNEELHTHVKVYNQMNCERSERIPCLKKIKLSWIFGEFYKSLLN